VIDLREARRKHREQAKLLREAEKAAGITAADRHRQLMAEKSRESSRQVAEIGSAPTRDEALYERYRNSLWLFLTECFPASLGLSPLSDEHHRIIDRLHENIVAGGQDLVVMPRGFVKSTIAECAAIWATGFGHRKFFVPIAATDEMARLTLDSIEYEFEANDNLAKLFPEACHAIRALEGVAQRAGKQTLNGELTRIEWTGDRIVLPSVTGFAGSGAIIWPRSILSKGLRGMRFKRPDGQQARPDFVLCDDLQTDESAASKSQTQKRLKALNSTVLRLSGHSTRLAIVIVGTIIEPDDLLDQLSDPKKHPAWRTMKVPMLKSLSKAHDEWLGKYAELRTSYNADDDADKARAEQDANNYYAEHRERLDEDAVATWQSCFNDGELSAVQHAYNIWIDSGEDAFKAECQNEPVRQRTNLVILMADEICNKQWSYERDKFGPDIALLTAFIDVHPGLLYWQVWAWEPSFSGGCIAYGEYPKQSRKYFSHTQPGTTLQDLFPGFDMPATITAALNALLHGDLLKREWLRSDDVPMRITSCGIDANGEAADSVKRFIRQSPFAAMLFPSYGRGITAKQKPISQWTEKRGTGPEWTATKSKPGEPIGILHDANWWLTRFQRGLALPDGSQGGLYLHKAKPNDHRMVGDHWSSGKPHEVTSGRTVIEWTEKPGSDNHHRDVAVGNMIAASRAGIGNFQAPQRTRRRRNTYYAA
jgi:hypothetical protein